MKSSVLLGAQTVSGNEKGAFTGEVSTGMLKGFGVTHVIVGHSERRAQGQTDMQVHAQIMQVLRARMTAVLCVGELVRDAQGDYFSAVETQLRAALAEVPASSLKNIVVAYEPVWAIGTGKQAHPEDIQEMKLFIQKCIAELFDRKAVPKVRILYGGSVSKDTAQELLEEGNADGFLIGGASLRAGEFTTIVSHAHTYANR
jgi:triosephosphate isomerase